MSLYVDVHVNDGALLSVAATRTDGSGCTPDSINTYRWVYYRPGGRRTIGHVEHRYGDGAVALAAKVLAAVAEHQTTKAAS